MHDPEPAQRRGGSVWLIPRYVRRRGLVLLVDVPSAQAGCQGRDALLAFERTAAELLPLVLITLMTAGFVTILWKLAGDQLATLFTQAMGSVTGP